MNKPSVSIVIPTYKDNDRLKLCLEALGNQLSTSFFFEVIVVNNDPVEELILDHKFFNTLNLTILVENTPGSYAARNKGFQYAKSEIIGFTDSDCIPDEDWLRNAFKYFEKDELKKIGIVAGDVPLFFKNPNSLTSAEIYEKYTGFDFASYVKEGSCGAGNWFSYKSVMEEFGGFDPQLKSNGDTDLSKRISKKHHIIFAPDVIVRHPARYHIRDIVYKYRRLIGGVYQRKFQGKKTSFFLHIINFSLRRFRFALKKIFTVMPKESMAITVVCMAITFGAWKEYFTLMSGKDTKR